MKDYKTKSFDYQDADGVVYGFTVKEEFFTVCPNPHLHTRQDLNNKFKLNTYLHDLSGPAAICISQQRCSYWIDGKICKNEQDWEIQRKNILYSQKLESIISE